MPSKEHIGFSIFAHFQLNEYVIHFVYIQHCNGSFPSFSQRMDTICILWWHRILIEKSSNFNEHRTASCIFSFIQHSRNSVCFWNWFFVFMQSHSPIVWWVLGLDESGAVRSGPVWFGSHIVNCIICNQNYLNNHDRYIEVNSIYVFQTTDILLGQMHSLTFMY